MIEDEDFEEEEKQLIQYERFDVAELKTVMLIGVYLRREDQPRCEECLEELKELSRTYGFEVKVSLPYFLRQYDAGVYIGKGKAKELGERCAAEGIDLVIFDDEISPNQQKNLEELFDRPVLDRTELILEVFAQRAQTKEARLQIELARSRYQLPRLKRLWTHLSRQKSGGGASGSGAVKGKGEQQIELDRRLVKNRIQILEKELKEVKAQRDMERNLRTRSSIPTFAIVGYTNAGKSTLLNKLTHAGILAEDKLFATLDTTTRRFTLPNHQQVLLIDTVGFIRKLPHHLVAAFRSTLEEACHTDLLIHMIDASHPNAIEQGETTLKILHELGGKDRPMITALNKIDRVTDPNVLTQLRLRFPGTVAICATDGTGLDALYQAMMEQIQSMRQIVTVCIPQAQYSLIAKLREEGNLLQSEYVENDVLLTIEIPKRLVAACEPYRIHD